MSGWLGTPCAWTERSSPAVARRAIRMFGAGRGDCAAFASRRSASWCSLCIGINTPSNLPLYHCQSGNHSLLRVVSGRSCRNACISSSLSIGRAPSCQIVASMHAQLIRRIISIINCNLTILAKLILHYFQHLYCTSSYRERRGFADVDKGKKKMRRSPGSMRIHMVLTCAMQNAIQITTRVAGSTPPPRTRTRIENNQTKSNAAD